MYHPDGEALLSASEAESTDSHGSGPLVDSELWRAALCSMDIMATAKSYHGR